MAIEGLPLGDDECIGTRNSLIYLVAETETSEALEYLLHISCLGRGADSIKNDSPIRTQDTRYTIPKSVFKELAWYGIVDKKIDDNEPKYSLCIAHKLECVHTVRSDILMECIPKLFSCYLDDYWVDIDYHNAIF